MPNTSDISLHIREKAYINGQWITAEKKFAIENPATQTIITQVADLTQIEMESAITAASAAFKYWRELSATQRADILYRWHHVATEQQELLATVLHLEQGKSLSEAQREVTGALKQLLFCAEEAKRISGRCLPETSDGRQLLVLTQPLGVIAGIIPWNYPVNLFLRKCAAVLAAGCTIVIKPDEKTPLTALLLAQFSQQAQLPNGVLNVITTSQPKLFGDIVTQHPDIRGISFTGSHTVGTFLAKQAAPYLKRMQLELGGNAPFIVTEKANLAQAARDLCQAKFRNAGQVCLAPNRILIQRSVYQEFIQLFLPMVQQMELSPLIDNVAVSRIKSLITDALAQGAVLLCGGESDIRGKNFFKPTVLSATTPAMKINQQEIFGPVAPLMIFDHLTEAFALANATPLGLAAYFYGENNQKIWNYARTLEFGMLAFNQVSFTHEAAPFGGVKQSGIGRENGCYGIEEFLEYQTICFSDEEI